MALAGCKPAPQTAQPKPTASAIPAAAATGEACKPQAPRTRTAPRGYSFPALTGRVVDGAGLLSVSQRRALSNQLVDAEKRSKHQFVVVTVKSLGGHDVGDYAQKLGSFWGIGRQCFDDGVLLVVAPNEGKLRIAVGNGLRAALTDQEAGAIIEKDILPHFKGGNYPEGIIAGSEAIIREITQ